MIIWKRIKKNGHILKEEWILNKIQIEINKNYWEDDQERIEIYSED